MKSLYALLFFVLISFYSNAQIVDIPDSFFKQILLNASPDNFTAKDLDGNHFKIDANDDGEIQVSEALATYYLDIGYAGSPQDLTGIEEFVNLEHLNFQYTDVLNSLDITQNVNLEYLSCGNLNSLDVTQNINLKTLICDGLINISTLDLSQNINLEHLSCENTPNLTEIDLSQNINLDYLNFEINNLSSLDVTQNINLKTLLYSLGGNNPIPELDLSQNISLEYLSLSSASITELDLSQNVNLEYLLVDFCQGLTELDVSQNPNLQTLISIANDIPRLFIKNGAIETLTIDEVTLEYVCADEDQLADVISHVDNGFSNVIVNSYCSFSPAGNYNTISGSVFVDVDDNGCDVSDPQVLNTLINIDDGTTSSFTYIYGTGSYNFYSQQGTFTLTPIIENSDWYNVSPTSVTIPFVDDDNNTVNQDFCMTPNGTHNDLEIVIVPILIAVPGFHSRYQIVYKNKGNQTLSGAVDVTFNDAVLDYVSASINPDTQATGNLSWNYTDLLPFESRSITLTLDVNSPMDTPAVNMYDVLNFTAIINPVSGDELPDDNVFELNQIVLSSFDPNDITCLEGDTVSPDKIGEYLHYNINFENTGTAAATFVVVKDVIDEASYDMSSLQIMYASHEMQTRVVDNTIEFIFDNINLQPEGKGNVVFKIKTQNSLTVGDAVENDAEIFFDYNFPIETNLAVTSFQALSIDEFETEDAILVFPNPSKNSVTLTSKSNLKSIQVYDAMARLVFEASMDDSSYTLNVSDYSEGIYFLKLKTAFGEKVERFVKN